MQVLGQNSGPRYASRVLRSDYGGSPLCFQEFINGLPVCDVPSRLSMCSAKWWIRMCIQTGDSLRSLSEFVNLPLWAWLYSLWLVDGDWCGRSTTQDDAFGRQRHT